MYSKRYAMVVETPGKYTTEKWLLNTGTISCECAPGWHMRIGLPPVVWWAEGDCPSSLFASGSFLGETENTGCPQKKMYTNKVNIPYYNVYIFLGHLYMICCL
jgi:hypothetical protein